MVIDMLKYVPTVGPMAGERNERRADSGQDFRPKGNSSSASLFRTSLIIMLGNTIISIIISSSSSSSSSSSIVIIIIIIAIIICIWYHYIILNVVYILLWYQLYEEAENERRPACLDACQTGLDKRGSSKMPVNRS